MGVPESIAKVRAARIQGFLVVLDQACVPDPSGLWPTALVRSDVRRPAESAGGSLHTSTQPSCGFTGVHYHCNAR